ncbi:MAG: hypothetical protein Q9212_005126 [Teloschistes hypoglaucus]
MAGKYGTARTILAVKPTSLTSLSKAPSSPPPHRPSNGMGTSRVSKMVLGQQVCDFLDHGGHPPNRRRRDNRYQENGYGPYGMPPGFAPPPGPTHGGWPPQPGMGYCPSHGGGGGHFSAGPLPGRGGGGSRATGSRSRASRSQHPSQSARRGGGINPFPPTSAAAFFEAERDGGGGGGAGRGWPTPQFLGGGHGRGGGPGRGGMPTPPFHLMQGMHANALARREHDLQFGGPYGAGHHGGGHASRGGRLGGSGRGSGQRGGRGGSAHRSRAARDPYRSDGF